MTTVHSTQTRRLSQEFLGCLEVSKEHTDRKSLAQHINPKFIANLTRNPKLCHNISLVNKVMGQTLLAGEGKIPELFLDKDVMHPDVVYSMASFSSQMLISDWNTLVTIEDTLTDIDYPIWILHIKSHQDDHSPMPNSTLTPQDTVPDSPSWKILPPCPSVSKNWSTAEPQGHQHYLQLKSSICFASLSLALEDYLCARNP